MHLNVCLGTCCTYCNLCSLKVNSLQNSGLFMSAKKCWGDITGSKFASATGLHYFYQWVGFYAEILEIYLISIGKLSKICPLWKLLNKVSLVTNLCLCLENVMIWDVNFRVQFMAPWGGTLASIMVAPHGVTKLSKIGFGHLP